MIDSFLTDRLSLVKLRFLGRSPQCEPPPLPAPSASFVLALTCLHQPADEPRVLARHRVAKAHVALEIVEPRYAELHDGHARMRNAYDVVAEMRQSLQCARRRQHFLPGVGVGSQVAAGVLWVNVRVQVEITAAETEVAYRRAERLDDAGAEPRAQSHLPADGGARKSGSSVQGVADAGTHLLSPVISTGLQAGQCSRTNRWCRHANKRHAWKASLAHPFHGSTAYTRVYTRVHIHVCMHAYVTDL